MSKPTIFDYQAKAGITKHIGGLAATEKLIGLCGIESFHEVLEAGCGVGQTSVFIAKRCGCRLVGVDILPGMVEAAERRALKSGVSDRLEFRVGDISNLPFEDGRFDVVFDESVTVFAPDHARVIQEYARVLKPGGVVGINEVVWLKAPQPPEVVAWLNQDLAAKGHTHLVEGWKELFEEAGLQIETVQVNTIDIKQEARGLIQRYGLGGFIGIMMRILGTYLRDPEYRAFVRETKEGGGIVPKDVTDYVGYGLFVARKPL